MYSSVAIFGIIHGLGFSYLLSQMLGKEESIIQPLILFNVGLEIGQLLIVTAVVLFSLLLTHIFKFPFKKYKQVTLCIIALIALKLCAERSVDYYQSL
jgi:ABC-type antimicrobial peptide transport system permease subunit